MNASTYAHICDPADALRAWLKTIARAGALVCAACLAVCAQAAAQQMTPLAPAPTVAPRADEREALVVDGETGTDVFGVGRSIIVRGQITHGALAFGGDVIVEGHVAGDVAAVGGSVIQRDGACIDGDVLVFGGTYQHGKSPPCRNQTSATIMYAGYEAELRALMRNPATILTPRWTLATLGLRVLAVLFWFIVSLALTAATPGAISRAATRLRLTSLRVAVIGFLGAVVISCSSLVSARVLPPVVSVFVGALALLLLLVAYLFGRVAIHAATGRWLQRMLLAERHRSDSVALLLGTVFWVGVLSLPYLWVLGVAGLLVVSLGLALTARYRLGWRLPAKG